MTTAPSPYEHVTFHGKPQDRATVERLKDAEVILGYELTILQGIGGAAASGGTHTDGRAVDLSPIDHERKVKVLRDLGFVAWYRPDLPGVWSAHVHAVLVFVDRQNRRGISATGFAQIGKYDADQDGLAGTRKDPNPYRPKPPRRFTMAQYEENFVTPRPAVPVTHVTRARDAITEAHHAAGVAIVELQKTAKGRVTSRSQIVVLRGVRRTLAGCLRILPAK